MKAIDKYTEHIKEKTVKIFCPCSFPWLMKRITEPHPDPVTCEGKYCKECWEVEYKEYYNKGNDCDCCENQYLCGVYGDAIGCKCADDNKECDFVEREDTE